MYDAFFDELSKNISLDYKEMINASTCTDNAEFILYKNNYYSLQQRFVTCLMYQAREELVYLIKSEE